MKLHRMLRAVTVALLIAAVLAAVGFVVMSLWNWLIPSLFGGPALHFWQAVGLLMLTRILVGRIGRGHGSGRGPGHWVWRGGMRHDWQRMTAEEREKLRESIKRRCGGRGMPESEPKA